ncbi:hypothetical protein C0995_010661 [Termitomyces sp. Mi166|nr:hypothetical protein C0995_010661 [Termitomyces sp. Mi166\
MPIQMDSSIVPDSTISSSPPATPAAVKRARRTYGRSQRTETAGDDSDTPHLHVSKSSSSINSVFRTGPLDMDEEVPPSSDPSHDYSASNYIDHDDDDEPDSEDASPAFQFSWRKKLKDIDTEEDDVAGLRGVIEEKRASKQREEEGHASALSPQRSESSDLSHLPTSPVESGKDTSTERVFGGSLSTLTSSSPTAHSSFARSPSPQVTNRSRRKKPIIHDSDSEDGENKESSPTSPPYPHQLTTPESRSSPTPPTSDDDMPALLGQDVKRKWKASIRPDVVPLHFSEEPVATISTKSQKAPKDRGGKRKKIKAPTKKELRETARNRLRIAADQEVYIPRTEAATSKYTIQGLFATYEVFALMCAFADFPILNDRIAPQQPEIEADPIGDFSSDRHTSPVIPHIAPSPPTLRQSDGSPLKPSPKRAQRSPLKAMRSLLDLDNDSDEGLPEVGALVEKEREAQENLRRQQELSLIKQRVLEMQAKTKSFDFDEDDDELQIVQAPDMQMSIEEEAERRSGRKKQVSEGRKRQLHLGGIGLTKQKAKEEPPKINDFELLRRAGMRQGKKEDPQMTLNLLNHIVSLRVDAARQDIIRAKEEEWIQRGGRVEHQEDDTTSVQEVSRLYAEKGLNLHGGATAGMDAEDDGDGSDENWSPKFSTQLRGSASPSPTRRSEGEDADAEEECDTTMVNDNDHDNPEEEEELDTRLPLRTRRPRAVLKAIVDSDDENVSLRPNFASHLQDNPFNEHGIDGIPNMAHRGSISSEDRTENEEDKENETSRMFDRGEDKENKAVVRHIPLAEKVPLVAKKGSLFGLESGLSPGSHLDHDENITLNEVIDDPFASPSRPSRLPTSFEARLKLASPAATQPSTAPLNLTPFIGAKPESFGFSEFPNDEPSAGIGPAPLQPGFSDLFESGTEKQGVVNSSEKSTGRLVDKVSPRDKLARADILNLTQDITLQPAFEVSGTFLRKADQIFEKEQEYVLEAANKKVQQEPELYVNDHGQVLFNFFFWFIISNSPMDSFLTQTRPNVSTPEIYRCPSPTPPQVLSQSQSQSISRRPLRTISLSDEVDFSSPAPLGRLHKRAKTPVSPLLGGGYRSSPSLGPATKRPANAFDILKRGSKAQINKPKRTLLDKSEFVEQEAQESDDDEIFGFGPRPKEKDDEEDEQDLDQTLETLVDDAEMDEQTLATALVMEKFQEHEKEDDEALQKLHEAAVQGELRKKRKNGRLGLDDSDDESDEDDHNRRIRRQMHKKQRIERSNIKELGEHEDTKSFFNVYQQNLMTDDADFAYLKDSQPLDIVMGNTEDVGERNDEKEEPREVITTSEFTKLIREAAQKSPIEEEEDPLDPNDVSWMNDNQSDDESHVRVKSVVSKAKKHSSTRRKAPDQTDFDVGTEVSLPILLKTAWLIILYLQSLAMPPPEADMAERSIKWAKVEGRSSHNGTTGRNVGGAAVTGHKAKAGGGSLRQGSVGGSTSMASANSESKQKVRAEDSVILKMATDSRTTRFG